MVDAMVMTPRQRDHTVWLLGLGVRFLVSGEETGGAFSIVEHPMLPRALGAPLHTHTREDEISYVIEGKVGVQIGDRVETAGPGAVIFKPRGVPHAFWNAGDAPAKLLEVITPAGFEDYFVAAAAAMAGGPPDLAAMGAICARYGLDMDFASVPRLIAAHNLAAT